MKELAERVRTLRTEAGLSQRQLAVDSRVSLRTIARIEAGSLVRPNPSTLHLLARALGVSETDLLENGEAA